MTHRIMQLTYECHLPSQHDEDGHDHIPSNGSTPSGIATPRPDLVDKRSPGIMHSYFGQVGGRPAPDNTSGSPPLQTPALDTALSSIPPKHLREVTVPEGISSHTSGHGQQSNGVKDDSPLLPHERPDNMKGLAVPGVEHHTQFPSPPMSSTHSFIEKDGAPGNGVEDGISSVRRALQMLGFSKSSSLARSRSNTAARPNPPSISTTASTVHASHFSNPGSGSSSVHPASPTTPTSAHPETFKSSKSFNELKRLTESRPGVKNTPPQTPRALSHDGSQPQPDKRTVPKSEPTKRGSDQQTNGRASTPLKDQRVGGISTGGPPIGTPKGKLSVKISEAKGLPPSYDPYVVCVFEWNEYISRGPRRDASKEQHDDRNGKLEDPRASAIRRADSDMGKPMAIPMKSRQSSNNSQMENDPKNAVQVTDPKWDHEAILYVILCFSRVRTLKKNTLTRVFR